MKAQVESAFRALTDASERRWLLERYRYIAARQRIFATAAIVAGALLILVN